MVRFYWAQSTKTKATRLLEKILYLYNNSISVAFEPILICISIGNYIQSFSIQSTVLILSCNSFVNRSTCDQINNKSNDNLINDSTFSRINDKASYVILIMGITSGILNFIFVHIYSKLVVRFSMRAVLIVMVFGSFLTTCFQFTMLTVDSLKLAFGIILAVNVLMAVFGEIMIYMTIGCSYITLKHPGQCTNRFAKLDAMVCLATVLGNIYAGFSLDFLPMPSTLGFAAFAKMGALIYLLIIFKPVIQMSSSKEDDQYKNAPSSTKCWNRLPGVDMVCEIFRMLTKYRKRCGRSMLLSQVLLYGVTSFQIGALQAIVYLYLRAPPFKMHESDFSIFVACVQGIQGVSLLIIMPLLRNGCRWSDDTFCVLSVFCKIAAMIMLIVAKNKKMLYTMLIFSAFNALDGTVLKTLALNILEVDEKNSLLALLGSVQALNSMVGQIAAQQIYVVTNDNRPYTVFVCLIGFVSVGFVPYLLVLILRRFLHDDRSNDEAIIMDDLSMNSVDPSVSTNATIPIQIDFDGFETSSNQNPVSILRRADTVSMRV